MEQVEIKDFKTPIHIDCFNRILNRAISSYVEKHWQREYSTSLIPINLVSSVIFSVYRNEDLEQRCVVLDGDDLCTVYFVDINEEEEIEEVYNDIRECWDCHDTDTWFRDFMAFIRSHLTSSTEHEKRPEKDGKDETGEKDRSHKGRARLVLIKR
jgi:hypothetical protein